MGCAIPPTYCHSEVYPADGTKRIIMIDGPIADDVDGRGPLFRRQAPRLRDSFPVLDPHKIWCRGPVSAARDSRNDPTIFRQLARACPRANGSSSGK